MDITHQNWKPDTCDCYVEEEYDRDDPNAVMTCSKVISKCQFHTNVPDDDLYGVLYSNPNGENKVKNLVHKFLLEETSLSLSKDTVTKEGTIVKELKDGLDYVWSFSGQDEKRVLNIDVKGVILDKTQQETIKTFCDATFGTDTVAVADQAVIITP